MTCLGIVSLSAQRSALVNTGSMSQSLGGITTTLDETEAVLSNFSALSSKYKSGLLLGSESRFGLSELGSVALGGFLRSGENGAFGVSLSSYGFELYNEQTVSGLYMRQLGKNVAASAEIGYYLLSLNEFGNTSKPFYRLGLSGDISRNLRYGLIMSNLESARINDETSLISSLAFGLAYSVSPKIETYLEIAKEVESDLTVKVGIRYKIHPKLILRIGARTASGQSGGGFSYKVSQRLDLQGHVMFHPVLGTTPGIGIKFQNSQKDNLKRSKG